MITTVQKWGNSLGVRIPMPIARDIRLSVGSCVDIREENEQVIIAPIKQAEYKLSDMLKSITQDNLHGENNFGAPSGKEIW